MNDMESRILELEKRVHDMEVSITKNMTSVTVDLKNYRDYMTANLATMEKATSLARSELLARLEGMNQIREQLNAQATSFITKVEFNAKLDSIMQSVIAQNKFMWMGMGALGVLSLAIMIVFKFL